MKGAKSPLRVQSKGFPNFLKFGKPHAGLSMIFGNFFVLPSFSQFMAGSSLQFAGTGRRGRRSPRGGVFRVLFRYLLLARLQIFSSAAQSRCGSLPIQVSTRLPIW